MTAPDINTNLCGFPSVPVFQRTPPNLSSLLPVRFQSGENARATTAMAPRDARIWIGPDR